MSDDALAPAVGGESGFWRLPHDHLAAVLARHDLSWESARVYLAVADLTLGYGRERDAVSLTQIAAQAGMFTGGPGPTNRPDVRHVTRALKRLAALGLYGQAPGRGQSVTRWVVWPPPPAPATTAEAGSGTTADTGSGATADAGSTATAGSGTTADAGSGTTAKATAKAGRHQDIQEVKKGKKKAHAADRPPPDPRVKVFIDCFCADYQEAKGQAYIVAGGKDGATIKRLLAALDRDRAVVCGLAELKRAARAMLNDHKWGRENASLGLLCGQINKWRGNGRRHERRTQDFKNGF
jgi:hypothetical protein